MAGNGDSNAGQRAKRLGGVTGRGFMPGKSGNPKGGRPATKGLLIALKAKLTEKAEDGQTYERKLVNALVEECLKGRNRAAAIQVVFDRIHGKPTQQLNLNDITKLMEGRSEQDLIHYAETGRWPGDGDSHER